MTDKQRFVHQYVERQRAYLPTYTNEDVWNERLATPSKPSRSNKFGFDTPVLRPRVPVVVTKTPQSQLMRQAPGSKPPRHGAESALPPERGDPPPTPGWSGPSLDKPRSKRKKAPTPTDTDNERAARLANRRERRKKKRAIVDPPRNHDEDSAPTATSKKGRKEDQKVKRPAALALMYGFSATNVTKDRLTVKPAPSIGVFSKGKASVKKKVIATKKFSPKNEIFSESAFLNKPSEGIADHPIADSDSDDDSTSSTSNEPIPVTHAMNHMKGDQGKGTEAVTLKPPRTLAHAIAESEVWDIERQSKLPSSARDVSSELGANTSSSAVLDLRGTGWFTHEAHYMSVAQSSRLTRSDPQDERDIPHAVDGAPSIHPSHSASQVGRHAVVTRLPDSRRLTSKYFAESVSIPLFAVESPKRSGSNDSLKVLDSRDPDQDVQAPVRDVDIRTTSPIGSLVSVIQPMADFGAQPDVVPLEFPSDDFRMPDLGVLGVGHTIPRAASLISSPISVGRRTAEFQMRLMMDPVEIPSDRSWYDECCAPAGVPLEPPVEQDERYFEPCGAESRAVEYHCTEWPPWCAPGGLVGSDVEYDFMQRVEGDALLAPEWGEEAQPCMSWSCMDETRTHFDTYEDDEGDAEDMTGFLEGRALLLGMSGRPQRLGLSGVAQAEMDVAHRLRDHWRPLRLS